MFRSFKRHYHLVKRAYRTAAESGNLGFRIDFKDGNATFSSEMPEREKTARFLTLIRKFLDEKSELYYKTVWESIKLNYPDDITNGEIKSFETGIKQIEGGELQIRVNDELYNPLKIYRLLSSAGYFESNEISRQVIAEITKVPAANPIFWNQFMDYSFNAFRIIVVLFDLILKIEKGEKFQSEFQADESLVKKCIYCLSETGDFNTEEHIIPESLGGDKFYLPKGYVCDECNNGISSQLDEALMNFEPIAFLRVQYTPYTKAGKFPKASFSNLAMERTDPNHIQITIKDKSGIPKNKKKLASGEESFNLKWTGKKLDWNVYARAIYKIALGFVAYDYGHEAALDNKFQAARKFVTEGGVFNNNMIVTSKLKPNHHIQTWMDSQFGGTGFGISIYGYIFIINLEEHPVVRKFEGEMNEQIKAISEMFKFDLISLKS